MKKSWLFIIGLGIGLVAIPKVSLAEEIIELERVVVTATKEEKKIKDVPVSASVITKKEIETKRVTFANEALKYEAGVYAKHGKFSDTHGFATLRGFPGTYRTLILLDGQPLNDAYTGGVTWSAIPTENIERIEVIKGPYSSLYGQNAMGGVINVITKTPKKESFSLKTSAAPNNTSHHCLNYGNKINKLSFSVNYEKIQTEGERTDLVVKEIKPGTATTKVYGWEKTKTREGKDAYLIGDCGKNYWDQSKYSGKLAYSFTPATALSIGYGHSEYEYGYIDGRTYLKDSAGNYIGTGTVELLGEGTIIISPKDFIASSWGRKKNDNYNLNLNTLIKGMNIKTSLGVNNRESFYIPPQTGATSHGGPGKLTKTKPDTNINVDLSGQIPIPMKNSYLSVGVNLRDDKVKVQDWSITNWKDKDSKATTTPTFEIKGKARIKALYTQAEIGLIENLTLFAGARYDTWKNYDASQFEKATTTSYPKKEKSCLSPRIGVVFSPELELPLSLKLDRIKASYGQAFRSPSMYELYRTWTWGKTTYAGNPDLDPETSKSYELGIDQTIGKKISLSTFYFQSKIEKLIYSKTTKQPDSTTIKKKENAGEGKISGFEVSSKLNLSRGVEIFGNYTRQNTKITSNPAATETIGKKFEYVPDEMSNVGFSWTRGKINLNCVWQRISERYATSDNSDTERGVYTAYDPVNKVDMKLGCRVKEGLTLSLAVDNLFDKQYYSYYKAPGRTLTMEARYKY